MEQFWEYRYPDSENVFELFSTPHLVWLAVLASFIILYTLVYNKGSEKTKDNMRKGLGLFLILYELAKQTVNSFVGVPDGFYLPLEICSMAEFTIIIDALWPKCRISKQMLAFAFLPAAFMALMMPTVTVYEPISFYAIHQFVMHAGIVAYVVALYTSGEIKPRYIGIWLSILALNFIIIPVYYINIITNRDYMYLVHPAGNPVLEVVWNLFGGKSGILYVIGLEVLVVIVMHIMYGIFRLLGRFSRGKSS